MLKNQKGSGVISFADVFMFTLTQKTINGKSMPYGDTIME